MNRYDQRGAMNILIIPLIVLVILFIGVAAFALWAFSGRQDYKNNTDKKIVLARAAVKQQTLLEEQKKYAEEAKNPYVKYSAPETYGSLTTLYPKNWSVYIASDGSNNSGLDVYMNPGAVLPTTDQTSATSAIRITVVSEQYSSIIKQFQGNIDVSASPYKLPKLPNVVGTRVEGQIMPNKQGSMVILPIRDKTLQIWTESANFKADLDNIILANATFNP